MDLIRVTERKSQELLASQGDNSIIVGNALVVTRWIGMYVLILCP